MLRLAEREVNRTAPVLGAFKWRRDEPITRACAGRHSRDSEVRMARFMVNGVAYDSLEAMPPDVRKVYDQTMAKLPGFVDRDGDGIPDVVGDALSTHQGVTMKEKLIVNGVTYEDEAALPPAVRKVLELAKQKLAAGGSSVTTNEIKMSFQLTGPGFHIHKSTAPSAKPPAIAGTSPQPVPQPTPSAPAPRPIEPDPAGAGIRIALVVAACAAGAVMLWLLTRAH